VLLNALHRRATNAPNHAAIATPGRSISNTGLWAEASAAADWLRRQGLSRGQTIGISVKDEYSNLVVMLGAMLAGLSQVGLATFDPKPYREAIAKRLKLAAVVADAEANSLGGFATVLLDPDLPRVRPASRYHDSENPAILYVTTSGTTGQPKIIPLNQRQLYLQGINFRGGPPRPETLYRPASIEFSASRKQRLYCLAYGGANVLADSQKHGVIEICRRFRVTELGISAAQSKSLLSRGLSEGRLPETTSVRIVGSPVPPRLRAEIMDRLTPALFVGYGASEFGAVATARPDEHDRHSATVGRVHAGVDLAIVDDDDQPVPTGRSGRIRVRSAGMATCYHDDEAANAMAFRGGWFYPGDAGHLGGEGDLRFDGRADDMMVLASINIFPSEIERAVDHLPGVVDCAAFAMESGEFGDVPLLAVVTDGTIGPESILTEARRTLGLRAPRKVFLVDQLPRNSAGKVQRRALRDLLGTADRA
jgi:long-chain acyl-CoA synthetase